MDKAEWNTTNDAYRMLEALWRLPQRDGTGLERQLHRFYLACCRAIWRLLPQEESRQGVDVGERYVRGQVNDEELDRHNWYVEGAAFNIDYNCEPEAIGRWIEQVRAIPRSELSALLHPPGAGADIEPRELLKRAAYFVDYAMIYPHLTPVGTPPKTYALFLSANLLREFVRYPFGQSDGGSPR